MRLGDVSGFNPLKGLAIVLAVFIGIDFLLLGGRNTRAFLRFIDGLIY